MDNYFVSYKISLILKEKGFDEKCFAYFQNGKLKQVKDGCVNNSNFIIKGTSAPIHEQVIDWLMNEHKLLISTYPTNSSKYMFGDWDCEIQNEKGTVFHSGSSTRYSAINLAITEALKLI